MPIRAIRDVNDPLKADVSIDFIDGTRIIDGETWEVVRVDPPVLGFLPDMHERIEGLGLKRLVLGYDNRWIEYGRQLNKEDAEVANSGHYEPETGGESGGRLAPTSAQRPMPAETAVADSAGLAAEQGQPTSRASDPTASSLDGTEAAVSFHDPAPPPEPKEPTEGVNLSGNPDETPANKARAAREARETKGEAREAREAKAAK